MTNESGREGLEPLIEKARQVIPASKQLIEVGERLLLVKNKVFKKEPDVPKDP